VNPIEKDPLLGKIEITNWIALGLFFALSSVFLSFRFSLGILLGGLISIVNFYWLEQDLKRVFQKLMEGSKSSAFFKYFIRFAVTAVVLYFIISADIVNVIGLLIGLSLVMINIVFTVFVVNLKKNRTEEVL
jgi:hypothetical protein